MVGHQKILTVQHLKMLWLNNYTCNSHNLHKFGSRNVISGFEKDMFDISDKATSRLTAAPQ